MDEKKSGGDRKDAAAESKPRTPKGAAPQLPLLATIGGAALVLIAMIKDIIAVLLLVLGVLLVALGQGWPIPGLKPKVKKEESAATSP